MQAQWVRTDGPEGGIVASLAVSGRFLFAGSDGGGVFRSTNSGISWSAANKGLTNTFVVSLAVSGLDLFAGTFGGGVFRSTDNGTSWTAANNGLTTKGVFTLAVSDTDLFAGTLGGGVWRQPPSEITTSVERVPTDMPTQFIPGQNYPNPFNPATSIRNELPFDPPSGISFTACPIIYLTIPGFALTIHHRHM